MKLRRLSGMTHWDSGELNNTVLLVGSGRSGTTWAQDLINIRLDYRMMFEPFFPRLVPKLQGWHEMQYLRPDNQSAMYLRPAEQILRGQVRSGWVDQLNHSHLPKKRLIKDIRVQLMLKWLRLNFAQVPVVMIMRHPCAVALSRLRHVWTVHLDDLLTQDQLMADHLQPFADLMRDTDDLFEQHVLMWCIENYVPLRQLESADACVVFYEEFCVDPETQIKRIMNSIAEPLPENLKSLIGSPDNMIRGNRNISIDPKRVDTWRRHLQPGQVARAMEIVGQFGLDKIYTDAGLPLVGGDKVLDLMSC